MATLDGAWFHLGIDRFHHIRARREWTDETFLPVFQRTVLGFHRAVAGMASIGNDVVVDHVLGERWHLADCLTVFDGFPVLFVGLRCVRFPNSNAANASVGIGRSAEPPSSSRSSTRTASTTDVDSERHTPAECSSLIRTRLSQGPGTAFDPLRSAPSKPLSRRHPGDESPPLGSHRAAFVRVSAWRCATFHYHPRCDRPASHDASTSVLR